MTDAGLWTIGLALAYTLFLVAAGQRARRRPAGGEGYFVGGRSLSPILVACCITGLFSGSSFIAIVELSYHTGVSAVWYGLAESVQVLIIAVVLLSRFRRRMLVTISGLIGDRFGRVALGVGGAITAFTFPMWSVATALAFASALYAFTGFSLYASVIFTAVLLLIYLWAGGMWSLAFTQAANCVIFALMLIVGLVAFLINPGIAGLSSLVASQPEYLSLDGVGTSLIVAWFGTFIVNVILAQAAFQMATSCRTPAEGRKGLFYALGFDVPFMVLGVVFGMAAALVVPGQTRGLVAVPMYMAEVLPAPLVGVFFLGIWACALGWGGPCQFSGATSLGRDVGRAFNPNASDADLVKYTRWSLVVLTGLMVLFGFVRTEESAWWNILAWTLRNGATFAPVVAALFWPPATRNSAILALATGFISGVVWNYMGGWATTEFYFGIHPVWVGMSVNLTTLVVVTLAEKLGHWRLEAQNRARRVAGISTGVAAVAVVSFTAWQWGWLHPRGLSGLAMFSIVVLVSSAIFALARAADELPGDLEEERTAVLSD